MFENSDAVSFATNGTATYHYPNPDPSYIGPFGSGATLKTDGEKIVGRVEAPAFKVGSVYRNGHGDGPWRLLPGNGEDSVLLKSVSNDCTVCSDWRLSDGRWSGALDRESSMHLLPGELVQRDGQWVAMEEAPQDRFTGVTVTILGGGGSGGSPNTPMLSRDARQPTARERSVMARIHLAKALAADWEAAKKQPALAHPYPFARNFQG